MLMSPAGVYVSRTTRRIHSRLAYVLTYAHREILTSLISQHSERLSHTFDGDIATISKQHLHCIRTRDHRGSALAASCQTCRGLRGTLTT
jgi:hypothetical protein